MNELVAWAIDNHVFLHPSINLTEQGEYGTQGTAQADVPAGRIASIPFSACMTPTLACEFFEVSFESIARENLEGPILALYLLYQKQDSTSRWREYIASLPQTFNTPSYWTDAALALLRGTDLEHEPSRRTSLLTLQCASICQICRVPEPSIEEWTWSMTVLSSRAFPSRLIDAFSVNAAGEQESHAILLPVLDTFNHDSGTHISWISDVSTQSIAFTTQDIIEQGAQVFNNYGQKTSEEFILGYGFLGGLAGTTLVQNGTRFRLDMADPLPNTLLQHFEAQGVSRHIGLLSTRRKLQDKRAAMQETRGHRSEVEAACERLARMYRDQHLQVVENSCAKIDAMLNEIKHIDAHTIWQDGVFTSAIQDCFGVQDAEGAETNDLTDVVMALYLLHSNIQLYKAEANQEEHEQVLDLWQQFSPYRDVSRVSRDTFGNVSRAQFEQAILMIWRESIEVDGIVTLFLYA